MRHRYPCRGVNALLAACFGLWLSSAPALAEGLLFHYQSALASDPKLRSAEANRNAIRERLPQARAGLLPQIATSASLNRNDQKVITDSFVFSQPAGKATYSSGEYRLNLSQSIYNGALLAGVRLAGADVERAEAEYAAARQELMVRVAQAYFDVLLAQEALALIRAEKETLTRQFESADARLKAGLAPVTELNDTRARFQLVVAQEIEAQNQLDDKREALREISGESAGGLARLGANMPLASPEPADINKWTASALAQNLSIQAAKAAIESARASAAQNRAGHYPTLDIIGSHGRTDADGSISGPGIRTDNTVVGLQLTVPLYQGGLVDARTREATYRYEASLHELEARRRAVERTTRATFQGVMGVSEKIKALQQTVESAAASLAAKTEGYKAGLYTTVNVLDATRDLYRAQRDLAEARHNYALNLLQLKLAAGTLSDDDLVTINGWLHRQD